MAYCFITRSHHSSFFPYQTGWRYSDVNPPPPNGDVGYRWGIGTNRDSGLIAGYRRLLDMRSAKTFTDDEAEYMTQSAMHHWLYRSIAGLANYEVTKQLPTTMQWSHSHDHTVGDAPANVCDGLQHERIRRREENRKEFNCTQWYI